MCQKLIEDSIFKNLQFTKEWIDLGIINNKNFIKIKEKYLEGDDDNTEHYRWWAFTDFLQNNQNFAQEKFYQIDNLGKNDPDFAMGRSMRISLMGHPNCPKELINTAIDSEDKTLSKEALKIKKKISNNIKIH